MINVRTSIRELEEKTEVTLQGFRLPEYSEIPDVGLYLKQVVKYVNDFIGQLGIGLLTESMVSNYVKQKILAPPTHKMYNRDQIGYLFFITITKNVLAMDEIRFLRDCQMATHSTEHSYKRFCDEFLYALHHISDPEKMKFAYDKDEQPERILLHNAVVTVTYKIYLDKFFYFTREMIANNSEAAEFAEHISAEAQLAWEE